MSRQLARSLGFCLAPLLLGSPLPGQSAWTKAPPLPQACYSNQDRFRDDASTAGTALDALIEAQERINRGIVDQVFSMDQATLQQRLMAAVQRNPARSQEIMQAIASMGTGGAATALATEVQAGEEEFQAGRAKLVADYKADKGRVMSLYGTIAPADQRSQGIQRTGYPAEVAENNQKYQAVLCPKWFGKEVPALLASYRSYLVERRIPAGAKAEAEVLRMHELLGVPTKDFRAVAELRAVADYLRVATELFGLRESEPIRVP